MIVLGCTMVICYNNYPESTDYWLNSKALNNGVIKRVAVPDRYCYLLSKMYYNDRENPANVSKTKVK